MSFLSSSPQPPQLPELPARPELRETIEVARPNRAMRMNLFIQILYPALAGMQTRGDSLFAQSPVEEVQTDEEQDDGEDPAPVLFRYGLADLACLGRGFRVEDGQPEGDQGGEKSQPQKSGQSRQQGGLVGGGMEGVSGGDGQADRLHMGDREQETEAGADGEGREWATGPGLFTYGQQLHQFCAQPGFLVVSFGFLLFSAPLFPKGVDPQKDKSSPKNHAQPPGKAGRVGGSGGVGEEITGA